MNRNEIARLARQEMNAHGFGHVPFEWDRGTKRLGAAHFTRNRTTREIEPAKMSLSAKIMPHMPEHEVRDVILHEIAHLMTPGHHHDRVWKAACRKIGANPKRTTDAVPEWLKERLANYVSACTRCGSKTYMQRRPKYEMTKYTHSGCGGHFGPLQRA